MSKADNLKIVTVEGRFLSCYWGKGESKQHFISDRQQVTSELLLAKANNLRLVTEKACTFLFGETEKMLVRRKVPLQL